MNPYKKLTLEWVKEIYSIVGALNEEVEFEFWKC